MVRRLPTLPLLAVLLLAACSPTTSAPPSSAPTPGGTPAGNPVATAPASPEVTPAGSPAATTVRVYFVLGSFTDDGGLVPVEREVPQTQAVGAAAMAALLTGPNQRELSASPAMYTDVPAGTSFLGLTIEGGIATVDLTHEFQAGGDSASVSGRMAQVVYTLTQFPTIEAVRFEFDGVPPKTVFIGSFGRLSYVDLLPAIWVDVPAWGGHPANPIRVTGLANVAEAQFNVEILDAAGHTLTDQPAHASCGTGCWGTFDVTLP